MLFRLFFILALTFWPQNQSAGNVLFVHGRSNYNIVISSDASSVERNAAKELQDIIFKVSSAHLPIINADVELKGNNIYIGYFSFLTPKYSIKKPRDDNQSFTYFSKEGNLFIYGGRLSGTMYGVFSFLENELGIHWLAPDCTIMPHTDNYILSDIYHSEEPAIQYRHCFYYGAQTHIDWSAHNKLNGYSGTHISSAYGGFGGLCGVHQMGVYISSSEYFTNHPEYFSLVNGRRIPDGQLCLSNKQVIQILTNKVERAIRDYPSYHAYDLSQNDNERFCTCSKCRAIENRYGGHSGLVIWAVNQVAENIKINHPDVKIITLAYQYTQHPPKGITPADNVIVQLSDIHNCFIHPSTANENSQFLSDLSGWQGLTPNVFLWDYVTNFFHFLLPYPVIPALQENYKLLALKHVYGVLAEGQYQTRGAGFDELNTWLISKIMWNPKVNVDSLAEIFINGYYGKASTDVLAYYQLCNSLVTSDRHIVFSSDYNNPIYSQQFISRGSVLLDHARRQVASNTHLVSRVDRLRAQILYLQVCKNKVAAVKSGAYKALLNIIKEQKMNIGENMSAEEYLRKEGFI